MAGDGDGSSAGRRTRVCQRNMFMTGKGDVCEEKNGRKALHVCDLSSKMAGPLQGLQPAQRRTYWIPCCSSVTAGKQHVIGMEKNQVVLIFIFSFEG